MTASGSPQPFPSPHPRLEKEGAALGLACAAAALAYDPRAHAALAKGAATSLLGIVALAWVAARYWRRLPPALVSWGLLSGWSLSSLGWSASRSFAVVGTWIGAACMAAAAAQLARPGRLEAARVAGATIGAVSSVVAIAQWLGGSAVTGLHGNPNWLGLALGSALLLTLDATARHPALWLVVAVEAGGLLLASSRTALVALALAGVVCLGRRRWLALVPLGGLTIGAGTLAGAAGGRMWIWRAAFEAGSAASPFGAGEGGFSRAFLDAQGAELSRLPLERAAVTYVHALSAHGDVLHRFVDGGLPALALLGVTFALGLFATRRRWPAGGAVVIYVASAGLGDVALHVPAVVVLLLLVLAVGEGERRATSVEVGQALALGAAASLLLALLSQAWLADRLVTAARDATPTDRLMLLRRASSRDPTRALELGLGLLESGNPRAAVTPLLQATRAAPSVSGEIALGNALLRSGDHTAAVAAYRRALAWHPGSFRARLNLAEALRSGGELDAAREHLEHARRLQPHHPKLRRLDSRLRPP